MLRATDVHFAYRGGAAVLSGVSVDVEPGSFTGILGPNGSGKTTLLKIVSGTLAPVRGTVTLDGVDLKRVARPMLARRMAVVPQETQLAFDYSVLEVVLMGRYPHLRAFEIEGPADFDIAREALAATGTLALETRQFATLSGGEKQRVVIASALAQIRPAAAAGGEAVLLLDEPTTALDLGYQLEIADLLRELRRRLPLAIVVSTHDLNFAAGVCDSLALLKSGVIRASGPTDSVLTAANVRELYEVEADVRVHPAAGHLVVVPLSRHGKGGTR